MSIKKEKMMEIVKKDLMESYGFKDIKNEDVEKEVDNILKKIEDLVNDRVDYWMEHFGDIRDNLVDKLEDKFDVMEG